MSDKLGHANNPNAFCLVCMEHPCTLIAIGQTESEYERLKQQKDALLAKHNEIVHKPCREQIDSLQSSLTAANERAERAEKEVERLKSFGDAAHKDAEYLRDENERIHSELSGLRNQPRWRYLYQGLMQVIAGLPAASLDDYNNAVDNVRDWKKNTEALRKLIHTNECSDELGWFAFWTPNGKVEEKYFDERVNGCESEAQAVEELIKQTLESVSLHASALADLRERCKEAEATINETTAQLPDTFYADNTLIRRVALMVGQWQKAVRVNQEIEAKFDTMITQLRAANAMDKAIRRLMKGISLWMNESGEVAQLIEFIEPDLTEANNAVCEYRQAMGHTSELEVER